MELQQSEVTSYKISGLMTELCSSWVGQFESGITTHVLISRQAGQMQQRVLIQPQSLDLF
jgi:hypothetical protein